MLTIFTAPHGGAKDRLILFAVERVAISIHWVVEKSEVPGDGEDRENSLSTQQHSRAEAGLSEGGQSLSMGGGSRQEAWSHLPSEKHPETLLENPGTCLAHS